MLSRSELQERIRRKIEPGITLVVAGIVGSLLGVGLGFTLCGLVRLLALILQ